MDPNDDDSKEFSDGYDENLMGDEEDRRRLALMTEKEREQELFNRSERRETLKIRFDIERKLKSKAKKREQAEKKPPKQVRNRKRLRASEIYSSDGSSEESDEYTPDANSKILNEINSGKTSNTKMTTRSALLTSSSESSASSSESSESPSSESEQDNEANEESDNSPVREDDYVWTLQDLKSLQLKRERIEDWIYAPFFNKTAIGLYVKISVANHPQTKAHMYKVAQVIDIIKTNSVYAINEGKFKTDKQCLVKIGRVERTYKMSFVSNRGFEDEDYDKWRDELNTNGLRMPNREHLIRKKEDLHRAMNYEFKDEDIAYQVQEKSRFNDIPHNFALRKTELMAEKADAEAAFDFEKARELQCQIDDLEERGRELDRQRRSEKFSGISIVNERNRAKNIVESERVLKESKNVKTEDPFTRRKCTPTIVHNKNNTFTTTNNQQELINNRQQQEKDSSKNHDNNNKYGSSTGAANGVNKNANGTNGNTNTNDDANSKDNNQSVNDLFQVHSSIDLGLDIDI